MPLGPGQSCGWKMRVPVHCPCQGLSKDAAWSNIPTCNSNLNPWSCTSQVGTRGNPTWLTLWSTHCHQVSYHIHEGLWLYQRYCNWNFKCPWITGPAKIDDIAALLKYHTIHILCITETQLDEEVMFLPPATCGIPADITVECSNIP